jgi:hypothetical protein
MSDRKPTGGKASEADSAVFQMLTRYLPTPKSRPANPHLHSTRHPSPLIGPTPSCIAASAHRAAQCAFHFTPQFNVSSKTAASSKILENHRGSKVPAYT